MAKVFQQSIPADVLSEYKQGLRPATFSATGYQYFVAGYEYAALVGAREPFECADKKGTEYPQISNAQVVARCNFRKAQDVLSLQPVSGGVEPPYTGGRNRSWWYDNMPEGFCFWNNYFVQQFMPWANKHVIPPWAQQPYIWRTNWSHSWIEKYNGNSLTRIAYTEGGELGSQKLYSPRGCCCDDKYVYVADDDKESIFIFNKDNLDFVARWECYLDPYTDFGAVWRVQVDNRYLYISEYHGSEIIVIDKATRHLVKIINVGCAIYELLLDYNFIIVNDRNSYKVGVFSRQGFSFLGWIPPIPGTGSEKYLLAQAPVSDGAYLYAWSDWWVKCYKAPLPSGTAWVTDSEQLGLYTGALFGDLIIAEPLGTGKIQQYVRVNLGFQGEGLLPPDCGLSYGLTGPQQFYWEDC